MIYYTMPRKGFQLFTYKRNEGFFIEGKNQADCNAEGYLCITLI